MKKITTLFIAMLLSSFLFQATGQARDISTILFEYNSLKNNPLPEMMVINQNFNEADTAALLAYFSEQRAEQDRFDTVNRALVPSEFYVLNVRGDDNYGTISGTAPFDEINSIVNPYGITCFADDFARNGDYYALEFLNDADGNPLSRTIVSINSADGSYTTIGDIGPDTGDATPTGLAYDFTTETMYLTANNILYTVDLTDGSLSEVGEMFTETSIWLVIDSEGNAYTGDISTDFLSSVDLTTGEATAIGPLNVDISFAQDATIDPDDGTLYMAAYTGGGTGGIYTVDLTTGEATLVGDTTPLDAEFGMFSVQGEPELGLDDNVLSNFTLFPNPSNGGMVSIKTQTAGNIAVAVFDVLGKQVINTKVVNNTLDISALKTGVYIVQIEQNGTTAQKKLIVR